MRRESPSPADMAPIPADMFDSCIDMLVAVMLVGNDMEVLFVTEGGDELCS